MSRATKVQRQSRRQGDFSTPASDRAGAGSGDQGPRREGDAGAQRLALRLNSLVFGASVDLALDAAVRNQPDHRDYRIERHRGIGLHEGDENAAAIERERDFAFHVGADGVRDILIERSRSDQRPRQYEIGDGRKKQCDPVKSRRRFAKCVSLSQAVEKAPATTRTADAYWPIESRR